MFSFLSGINLTKVIIYIAGMVLIVGLIVGGYLYWKHDVQANADLQLENVQLKQTIADQQNYITQLNAINAANQQSITDLQTANTQVNAQLKSVEDYLYNPSTAKDDRPSSVILQETIRQLQQIK